MKNLNSWFAWDWMKVNRLWVDRGCSAFFLGQTIRVPSGQLQAKLASQGFTEGWVAVIPEPASMTLLFAGILAIAFARAKRAS